MSETETESGAIFVFDGREAHLKFKMGRMKKCGKKLACRCTFTPKGKYSKRGGRGERERRSNKSNRVTTQ
jgi:hypothetical protein